MALSKVTFTSGVSANLIAKLGRINAVQGLCYQPIPSDATSFLGKPGSKYFDSDFTNSSFPKLWGGTRNDLGTFATQLGVNFLHLYDWSVPPAVGQPPVEYHRESKHQVDRGGSL